MEKKLYLFIFFLLIFLILNTLILFRPNITGNIIKDSEEVIENLYKAIDIAEQKGEYKCCVEPACTMCYLGHWKFEKGTCYCDDAIAEGRNEDVCPECKSGLEKGLCKSVSNYACEFDPEEEF